MATEPPHEHKSVHDWVMLFENVEESTLLTACDAARAAWSDRARGLGRWLDHVAACPACRQIARTQEGLLADDCLGCPECRDALQVVYDLVDLTEHYEPVTILELHRAEEFMEELAPFSLDEQITRVRAVDYYQQWGVAQRLLLDAQAAWHRDPQKAHDRALLAVAVASKLDPDSYGAAWIADLRAKAHAYLANAHRILGQFIDAEIEFTIAEAHLRQGVRSGQAQARVFSLKASLLKDQHRHHEALALLAQVERFHEEHGERHEAGRIALQRSTVLDLLGEPREAAEEASRAAAMLDPAREPELRLAARNNSISFLLAAGDIEQARALFDELPPMPEPLTELERRWLEANLLRSEGRHGEARTVYELVRTGLSEAGMFYRAALASLDLAVTAHAEGGRRGEVLLMAEQAAVQLTLAGAKPEAFTALRLVLQAAREDAVTLAVIDQVRRRLAALQPS